MTSHRTRAQRKAARKDARLLRRAAAVMHRLGYKMDAHFIGAVADRTETGEIAPPILPEHRCYPLLTFRKECRA